jgi:hypothetical protein
VTARAAGTLAFIAIIVSGIGHLALQYLPRPWSVYGHIDIAQLLHDTPIFTTHWPYWTFPFEYHPVVGWGSALLSYLTGDLIVVVVLWLAVVALAARATAVLLARRVGGRRAMVFWSLAPQLLLFGGQNFDALATLTLVYAAAALRVDRPIRAGVSIAIGAATKLFPLVAAPPYLVALWHTGSRRAALLFGGATLVAFALIDGPAIIAPFSLLSYGVTPYGVSTWNVDSIWLPVAMLLDLFVRADEAAPLIAWLSLGGLVATYLWLVVRPPQYAIWLLPIFALYVPDVRLLLFMFVGDLVTFLAIFALRGETRDVLGYEAVPFYLAILAGVVIRQIAVARLLLRARAS